PLHLHSFPTRRSSDLLTGMAALILWPVGALLLWPTFSLIIVAVAYFRFGAAVYRKRDAVLPWSTVWALGPCLFGQHVSRWCYRRSEEHTSELQSRSDL